ncbi:beta-ketoacyl synthase, partial [Pelagophyceae sp. CCMP2097]
MGRWDTAALASRISSVGAATLQAAQFGGFTRGAADFEPARFLLRPAEARALDPQQRLLLDRCAEVLGLDDSAAARARVRGANIAVAVGMMSIDAVVDVPLHKVGPHELTGNGYAAAGSRLSFLFDLHGPAVVVDTACSAALVAGHLAAKFVRDGEAESAVFGGVSLMLTPSFVHVGVAAARMSSATGRCHTFDARADGYCRAEGCAVALLERRGAAKDAAVWAGSAVRHNGQSATFTALNASSQRKLLDAVLSTRRASVVSVEAHGTGTGLGDP